MDFNKLTIKSGEAVAGAQELARRLGNPELYPEHLALAILDQELPRTLVERAGGRVDELRARAEAVLRGKPSLSGGNVQPQAAAAFRRVLDKVLGLARSRAFFSFPAAGGFLAWQRRLRYRSRCDLFLYRREQLEALFDATSRSYTIEPIDRDFFVTVDVAQTPSPK